MTKLKNNQEEYIAPIGLSKTESDELARAIDLRIEELDKLRKSCVKTGSQMASTAVVATINLLRKLRERITGSSEVEVATDEKDA